MRNFIIAAILVSFAAPAFAASSPLLGNMIVTAERVWYDKPVLAPGYASLTVSKPYSQEAIASATADCTARGGVLNTCSAVCGLNGCFSTCALACEFPKVQQQKKASVAKNYTEAKADYGDTPKTSKGAPKTNEGKALKKEFDAAAAKYSALKRSENSERALVKKAVLEWEAFTPLNASQTAIKNTNLLLLTKTQDRLYEAAFMQKCGGGPLPSRLPKHYRPADPNALSIRCNPASDEMLVTFGAPYSKTYGSIKAYADGKWHTVNVGGSGGAWVDGGASAVITSVDRDITALAVYQCTPAGTSWKCGCTDSDCTTPRWQVAGIGR